MLVDCRYCNLHDTTLAGNGIGVDGARAVAKALAINTALMTLDISS